jgi:hypothetical protein
LSPMVTIGSSAVEERAGGSGRSGGLGEAAQGAAALKARWAHEAVSRSEPPGHAFLGLRIFFLKNRVRLVNLQFFYEAVMYRHWRQLHCHHNVPGVVLHSKRHIDNPHRGLFECDLWHRLI